MPEQTILEASESDDPLDELRAMRRRIAAAMDDPATPARDLAALSRRALEIRREIDDVDRRAAEEAEDDADIPDEAWEPL